MIVQCAACQARFKISDDKVTERGVKVRCTKCSTAFVVRKEPQGLAPAAMPISAVPAAGALPATPPAAPARPDPFASFAPAPAAPAAAQFSAAARGPAGGAPARQDPFAPFQTSDFAPGADPFGAADPKPSEGSDANPFSSLGAAARQAPASAGSPAASDPFGLSRAAAPAPAAGSDPFGLAAVGSSAPAAGVDPFGLRAPSAPAADPFAAARPPAAAAPRPALASADPFAAFKAQAPAPQADSFARTRTPPRPNSDPFASFSSPSAPSQPPATAAMAPAARPDPFAQPSAPPQQRAQPRGGGDPFAEPGRPPAAAAAAPAADEGGFLGGADPFAGLPSPDKDPAFDSAGLDLDLPGGAPVAPMPAPGDAFGGPEAAGLFGPKPRAAGQSVETFRVDRTSVPEMPAADAPAIPARSPVGRPAADPAAVAAQVSAARWSRPRQVRRGPRRNSGRSLLRALACVLAGVALAGAAFFVELSPGEAVGATLLAKAMGAPVARTAGGLSLQIDSNSFYETRTGHPVFVVRGTVRNLEASAAGPVRVAVELVDGSQVSRRAEALAGVEPSPEDVFGLVGPEKLVALEQRLAPQASPIAAGESARFAAIFFEYPDDLERHSLRVVEAVTKEAAAPAVDAARPSAPAGPAVAAPEPAAAAAAKAAGGKGVASPAVGKGQPRGKATAAEKGKQPAGKAGSRSRGTQVRFKPPPGN